MYNHQKIEKKWQKYWQEHGTFTTSNTSLKPKYYVLDMFPYPSGAGLHVGHPEGYTANDIIARYKHAKGHNVLHPMGWDAFGLPAENYAIKTGTHPSITTQENISNFRRQIRELGFSYDWDREIDTTDPKYFQWTQWIFLKLFEQGLAYEQDLPINYCPSCGTGLANEEVLGDFTCERCGDKVVKKKLRQWVLAITKYADRLLNDVDDLDWPEGIKDMQRNWIGKSEGCEFELKKADDATKSVRVYTTRVDTVFGMTYCVIAPDHPHVSDFITDEYKTTCEAYIDTANHESDQDRTSDDKEKTGVFSGSYVINPYNGEKVPLWIADYVLGNYGTGAVMAVPAHDERDFEFAKKYNLEIRQSIAKKLVGEGEIAPRKNVECVDKVYVNAIIEFEEKFLLLKEEVGSKFVGGSMEKGETPLEAIKREILEEAGYHDFASVTQIENSAYYGYAYRNTKGINQKGFDEPYFHVQLASLKQQQIDEEELAIATPVWMEKHEVKKVLVSNGHENAWEVFTCPMAMKEYGFLMNSGDYNKLSSEEAKEQLTILAEEKGFGSKKTNYKLRDWLFSRQRYWGEPIPLIHLEREDVRSLPRVQSLDDEMEKGKAYVLKENTASHSEEGNDEESSEEALKNTQNMDSSSKDSEGRNYIDERTLCSKGQVKSLVVDGKIISKIYSGIYTDIVCDYNLPLELPEVDAYEPAGDGNSPLIKVDNFVNVSLANNLNGKRETNTMPQWGGSCWYYLRFMDAKNPDELVGSEVEKYWGQVDSYVGGAEHAVLHLLYARFWHKFLFDIGVVSTNEPFYRLRNQGMILGTSYRNSKGKLIASDMVEEKDGKYIDIETGEELEKIPAKMSKSLKNVINPDEIVEEYGADTLRLYEMYMADFKDSAPWDTTAIIGVRRFLDKVHNLFLEGKGRVSDNDDVAMKVLHKTIKKVEEDIENYKFNTALAQMMICINQGEPQDEKKKQEWRSTFVRLLHPFAPHLAEEIWENIRLCHSEGNEESSEGASLSIQGMDSSVVPPSEGQYKKVYFATGNKQKIDRLQSVFSWIDENTKIESYTDIQDVEETGATALECALQKLEVYKDAKIDAPILTNDAAVYFDGQDFDPTHVRREALASGGYNESEMTQDEISDVMTQYYKNLAKEAGGKLDFYYIDAWAVLFPNGEVKTAEYRREYILTDEEKGERMPYFPMRPLYISRITGKHPTETTPEDFRKEFACQREALEELFGYGKDSVFFADWPHYDEAMTVDNEVTIGVQVLGKLRGEITISKDEDKASVLEKAKTNENVIKWLEGKEVVKEIYVPGKIVNLVVK